MYFRRVSVYAKSDLESTRSRFVYNQVLRCSYYCPGGRSARGICVISPLYPFLAYRIANLEHILRHKRSKLAYQLHSRGNQRRGLSTCLTGAYLVVLSCLSSLEQGCIMHLHFPSSSPNSFLLLLLDSLLATISIHRSGENHRRRPCFHRL